MSSRWAELGEMTAILNLGSFAWFLDKADWVLVAVRVRGLHAFAQQVGAEIVHADYVERQERRNGVECHTGKTDLHRFARGLGAAVIYDAGRVVVIDCDVGVRKVRRNLSHPVAHLTGCELVADDGYART